MVEVIPSIIPLSWDELEEGIKKASFAPKVQVDISDGIFSKTKTWPYNGGPEFFDKLKSEQTGWPEWQKVDIELDMLVARPEDVILDWISTGITSVVVHIESTKNFQNIIEICKDKISLGIGINPSTNISQIETFEEQVDFIQVMGSDDIGKHGVSLENLAIEKIKLLRQKYPERIIAIDIGVNEETAPILISAGANKLISGSAIMESANPFETWKLLQMKK